MKKAFVIATRFPRFTACLCTAIFCVLSCAKVSPSHRNQVRTRGDSVVDGQIAIERSTDGLSAILTFNTAYAASCAFAWYEDKTPEPGDSSLTWTACTSPQPGRVFKETATGLKPEILYAFAVKIWAQGSTESSGKIQRVHENAAPGDPNNRYTLRVDLPTKSAQIDGYNYAASLDSIQKDFLSIYPCKVTNDARSFPGTRITAALPVKRVTSRGFYSGISAANEDLSQGLVMGSAVIQTASSEWVLNIQSTNTSGTLRLTTPAQLVTIAATQNSTQSTTTSHTTVENTLDDVELAAFRMAQNTPLQVTWTINQTADLSNSLVIVTLTSPNKDVGISCGFDPKSGGGLIPADILAKLSDSRGFLTVRLESLQQPIKDRWFARIIDWRSIQVLLQ